MRLIGCAFNKQGRTDQRHEDLADAIELLHVGSLIHDDILDDADVRRGVRSVHVGWDAKVAVLAGDYLLARSSQLVAGLGEQAITKRLAEVMAELCEGELMQDEQLFDLELTLDAYLERVAKKAASPFELACEGAAILSGAYGREAAVARRLGFHLGRLFQLVDDWLDWNVDAATLGKPAGRDLLAGSITLPVLVALQPVRVDADSFHRGGLLGHTLGQRGDVRLKVERTNAQIARQLRSLAHGVREIHLPFAPTR